VISGDLKLHPIHPHRRRSAAALLDEGEIPDPGLVVAAGRSGAEGGAERAAEEVLAIACEAGLFHGSLQGEGVGFQQHGAQVGLLQGRGSTELHF